MLHLVVKEFKRPKPQVNEISDLIRLNENNVNRLKKLLDKSPVEQIFSTNKNQYEEE